MKKINDPTERFTSRVGNYIKYRPGYPVAIIPYLAKHLGLKPGMQVADIGSGTGLLTELFLENGNPVIGIEPNQAMRQAGEAQLKRHVNFTSVNGTAEVTTLEDNSVDLVIAGQAFHWFDFGLAKKEFTRILRPRGHIVLIWNVRDHSSPVVHVFEDLLREFGTDYHQVVHTNFDKNLDISKFFAPNESHLETFHNHQMFDLAGLTGRLLSASYAPSESDIIYQPMLATLEGIFDQHQSDGEVKFEYQTEVYWSQSKMPKNNKIDT